MELVSIIIPVYNTGEPFRGCIESVVQQTYPNLEIIVVDDCSTDELTLQILKDYQAKDQRIKVIRNEQNSGLSFTRNAGVAQAQGTYFSFLDSDDQFVPNFVETMVQALEQNNTDFAMCYFHNYALDPSIKFNVVDSYNCKLPAASYYDMHHVISEGKLFSLSFVACAKLFKRKLYQDLNLTFDKDIRIGEDTEWALRCLTKFKNFTFIDFVGIKRLIRLDSLSHQSEKDKLLKLYPTFKNRYQSLQELGVADLYFIEFLSLQLNEVLYVENQVKNKQDQLELCLMGIKHLRDLGYDLATNLEEATQKMKALKLRYKLCKILFNRQGYHRNKALYYANKKILDFIKARQD